MTRIGLLKSLLYLSLATFISSGAAQAHADAATQEAIKLMAEVDRLHSKCRGSGDDPYTFEACYDMEKPSTRLKQLDWCYGPIGEVGYKQKWIRCSSDPKQRNLNKEHSDAPYSNWKKFSSNIYTINPEALNSPSLVATIFEGEIFLNLIETKSSHCGPGTNGKTEESSPYLVNNTYVRFYSSCVDGTRVFGPITEAGKKLLRDSIETGSTKIEVERLPPLIFFKTDFESVKRELRKTQSAL